MSKKSRGSDPGSRLAKLDKALWDNVPHLASVLTDEDHFISVLCRQQDDSTYLMVLKRYGPDGGPMVCFGGGYGVAGAFMALNATIASDRWRVDTPWPGPNGT